MNIIINRNTTKKQIQHTELYNYLLDFLQFDDECTCCTKMGWKCPQSGLDNDENYAKNCNKCSLFLIKKFDSLFGLGRTNITNKELSSEAHEYYNAIIESIIHSDNPVKCWICKDFGWDKDCPANIITNNKLPQNPWDKEQYSEEQTELFEKSYNLCKNHVKAKIAQIFNCEKLK